MARMAHSVSILTTGGSGMRDGLVVTAVSSVSADLPRPCLLACVNAGSRPAGLIHRSGVFCLNVLADAQMPLSERFAGRSGGSTADWFAAATWTQLATGAPALDGALANFDCAVDRIETVGSHLVIFGSVLAVRSAPGRPLLHAGRAYARLED